MKIAQIQMHVTPDKTENLRRAAALLEQAGHSVDELKDWTWEDMHQIAKDISALGDGIYGHTLYWDEDAWPWESAVYSNGGSIDNEDGTKIVFDEASGTPILDLTVEMLKDGSSSSFYNDYDYTKVSDAFYQPWAEGKLGMYIGSITMYKSGLKFRDNYEGEKGDFDIVLAACEYTEERALACDFSDPYYTDLPPVILVKASNADKYKTVDDINQASVIIGAQKNTTKAMAAADMFPDAANGMVLESLVPTLVTELKNGTIDLLVLDGNVGLSYVG